MIYFNMQRTMNICITVKLFKMICLYSSNDLSKSIPKFLFNLLKAERKNRQKFSQSQKIKSTFRLRLLCFSDYSRKCAFEMESFWDREFEDSTHSMLEMSFSLFIRQWKIMNVHKIKSNRTSFRPST